jgi:hypothetical protein
MMDARIKSGHDDLSWQGSETPEAGWRPRDHRNINP